VGIPASGASRVTGACAGARSSARRPTTVHRTASRGELTEAERRIAGLVAEGLTNREVAAALFLAEHSVETALSRVYRKLGVRSRTELAARRAHEAEEQPASKS
jgi:DNA-binding CsgD family transcriptional regulator